MGSSKTELLRAEGAMRLCLAAALAGGEAPSFPELLLSAAPGAFKSVRLAKKQASPGAWTGMPGTGFWPASIMSNVERKWGT